MQGHTWFAFWGAPNKMAGLVWLAKRLRDVLGWRELWAEGTTTKTNTILGMLSETLWYRPSPVELNLRSYILVTGCSFALKVSRRKLAAVTERAPEFVVIVCNFLLE